MRQMKTKHLTTQKITKPKAHLIRPAATFSPSDAEKGMPPTFPERLLTAKEISPRLFIKPRTAALWARQGRIPAYRIGRKLGFKWEEVERALPTVSARCVPHGPSMPLAGLPRGPLGDC